MSMRRIALLLGLIAVVALCACGPGAVDDDQARGQKDDAPAFGAESENDDTGSGEAPGDRDDDPSQGKACEKIPLEPVELPDISTGPSVVTLDAEGFFVVNGVKFFPYGFYGHPTGSEPLQEMVDAGFNAVVAYGGCCQGGSLQTQIDRLNLLGQYGILGAVHAFSPVSQIYTETLETLGDWIDARNAAGSTLFWYTYDEPGIWSKPKQEVSDYHDLLHLLDPDHPNALVMAPAEDFSEYMDYTDFMMVDPYPSPYMPLSQVKYALLEAQAAAGSKRVFGVGQAFDWYDSWGTSPPGHTWRPYVWEMRNMTYQNMVFGVNGLVYFAYPYVHGQPERWEGLKQVANEVRELMPILLVRDAGFELVEDPDVPYVDVSVREHSGAYYLLVVSTWWNDVTVSYDLSPLGDDLCVIDYFSASPVEVSTSGIVTLQLVRGGEAVLQILPQ